MNDLPDRRGMGWSTNPSEVFVTVPDGLGKGGVIREQGLSTGASICKYVLLGSSVKALKTQTLHQATRIYMIEVPPKEISNPNSQY